MYFFYYLPVGINVRLRRVPVVTVALTAICILCFVAINYLDGRAPFDLYGLVYIPYDGSVIASVASGFIHFGYVHLIGNLLYLFLFGRYVEDRMGRWRFSILFLSSVGLGNYLQGIFNAHVLHDPFLGIVGASGGVSGLLGAFSVRFFMSKLQIAYWAFLPLQAYTRGGKVEMPAFVAILLWFGLQLFQGIVQVGGFDTQVAYVTHLAGFAWGAVFALALGQLQHGKLEALMIAGDRHMRKGEPYAAQGAYIRYLTGRPHDGLAYASLARAMVLTGNKGGARKNYQKACESLIDQGHRGDGEAVFEEASRSFERFCLSPQTQLDLSFGLERNLKSKAALLAYQNFQERYPDDPEAGFTFLRMAVLHATVFSSPESAAACYRRLVERYPDDRWADFAHEQLRLLELRKHVTA